MDHDKTCADLILKGHPLHYGTKTTKKNTKSTKEKKDSMDTKKTVSKPKKTTLRKNKYVNDGKPPTARNQRKDEKQGKIIILLLMIDNRLKY
jgi:uncharacterized Zn-finger protein